MYIHCIVYQLNEPYYDYSQLERAIKRESRQCVCCLDNTWIVRSEKRAKALYESLMPHISKGDKLLVFNAGDEHYSCGFKSPEKGWLIRHWQKKSRPKGRTSKVFTAENESK
jgi:hypothetical protein